MVRMMTCKRKSYRVLLWILSCTGLFSKHPSYLRSLFEITPIMLPVVLEGFRTTFFRYLETFFKGLSTALLWLKRIHSVDLWYFSFTAPMHPFTCKTNSGPQCCEGFVPLSMEQQSHKESTDNSPLSEGGSAPPAWDRSVCI